MSLNQVVLTPHPLMP